MANEYVNQHKLLAMGLKVDGQKMASGSAKAADTGPKGVKGDPKATPALMSKGKQNA